MHVFFIILFCTGFRAYRHLFNVYVTNGTFDLRLRGGEFNCIHICPTVTNVTMADVRWYFHIFK